MSDNPVTRLVCIMARLRDPSDGCPWDVEQTFDTIAPYTIEEAYEVADAIDRADFDGLKDELGDLLFQVAFHARMAEEAGKFDFAAVAEAICEKMVRRHPHVFGDETVSNAEQQTERWEAIKAKERAAGNDGPVSALDGVATGLPALSRALKLQRRAARVGFDWIGAAAVMAKIGEELHELDAAMKSEEHPSRIDEEIGDVLFSVVNLARHLGVDPDGALRRASAKFDTRFRAMECEVAERGRELAKLGSAELDELWRLVKSKQLESAS